MSTDDVIEETRMLRAQVRMGKNIWLEERMKNRAKSGDGYLRWTDPAAVKIVGYIINQASDAGCEWADIQRAIEIVAEHADWSPRRIFDVALQEQATRIANQRRIAEDARRSEKYEGPTLPKLGRIP